MYLAWCRSITLSSQNIGIADYGGGSGEHQLKPSLLRLINFSRNHLPRFQAFAHIPDSDVEDFVGAADGDEFFVERVAHEASEPVFHEVERVEGARFFFDEAGRLFFRGGFSCGRVSAGFPLLVQQVFQLVEVTQPVGGAHDELFAFRLLLYAHVPVCPVVQ